MTREEAIKILKEIEYPVNGDNKESRDMALDMAIKALEQEPCEDAISRKAVLVLQQTFYEEAGYEHKIVEVDDIKELPSVTPTNDWISADLQSILTQDDACLVSVGTIKKILADKEEEE